MWGGGGVCSSNILGVETGNLVFFRVSLGKTEVAKMSDLF